ncbi:hypothetical protein CWE23_00315 [Idiomarina aquatica]|uniref:Uncharacterized protein n=1 Tax=Idiomarina aquatica TaxID=1327752 RepID=A0AA94EEW4_9GAMM|nr:hypothetical protein CWE23_00315 [Idiomarina aquatica]
MDDQLINLIQKNSDCYQGVMPVYSQPRPKLTHSEQLPLLNDGDDLDQVRPWHINVDKNGQ